MDQTTFEFVLVAYQDYQLRKDRNLNKRYQARIRINGKIVSTRRWWKTASQAENYGQLLAARAYYLFNNPALKRSPIR